MHLCKDGDNMEVKRLLFVGWYPNNVEKYKNVFFRNLIFAIADLGIDCTVISPVSYMRYKKRIVTIPLEEYQETPSGNKVKVYYPRIFSASSKQIGKYNTEKLTERLFENGAIRQAVKLKSKGIAFDAVYGHFFLYGGLAAIKIGRKLKCPSFVAFGECDYESQIQKTYGDLTIKDIDGLSGVISVSSKNARKLDELGIFKDIPVITAPNAVDKSLFKKMDKYECRIKLDLPIDKFIVGFVGGFIERKGDKRLLEAVNKLDEVYVAFAGVPGNDDVSPSGEKVLMCKPLAHEDIPVLLNAVDVFCLPTLSEGSCNAVAEALSCGVPVISSDLPFNDDVLNFDNSIRINPNSVEEIRDSILKLKNDESFRDSIANRGYSDSIILDINNRADKIYKFMNQVCQRGHDDKN